jgi:hypothetical protein
MAKLIYTAIASLDGYIADAEGRFDWSAPDAEVHAFVKPDGLRARLQLLDERRFGNGVVHLHYAVAE